MADEVHPMESALAKAREETNPPNHRTEVTVLDAEGPTYKIYAKVRDCPNPVLVGVFLQKQYMERVKELLEKYGLE